MARVRDTGILTIAAIREGREGKQILFNERQQIFSLGKKMRSTRKVSTQLERLGKKETTDPGGARPEERYH